MTGRELTQAEVDAHAEAAVDAQIARTIARTARGGNTRRTRAAKTINLPATLREAERAAGHAASLLVGIRALLDLREWSTDTCQEIAALMVAYGYIVREPRG